MDTSSLIPHLIWWIILLIIIVVHVILKLFRAIGGGLTPLERKLVVFFLILGTKPTQRIVVCSLNLFETNDSIMFHPAMARHLMELNSLNYDYIWTVSHSLHGYHKDSFDAYAFGKKKEVCQHNIFVRGSYKSVIKQTQIYFPNLLIDLPKEEFIMISPSPQDDCGCGLPKPRFIIKNRPPAIPNVSIFADIEGRIFTGIRIDHIYTVDDYFTTEKDEIEMRPDYELANIRVPLLTSSLHQTCL